MILDSIREGKIVPSEVTVKLIEKEMESSKNNKFLIDGFPRTEENRIAFERVVSYFNLFPYENCLMEDFFVSSSEI